MLKMYLVITMITSVYFTFCSSSDNNSEEKAVPPHLTRDSKNSEIFNKSFEKLLNSYYSIKDALVEYDTIKANAASKDLAAHAENLNIQEIKNDSSGVIKETAKNYTGTISGSALGLAREIDIIKKKKEFQMISDAMYDLVRTVQYDKQKIYHQHCPMAFNDEEEAYWLSNSSEILNPYLGKKHPKYRAGMLECGEVTDSLDFSRN